MKAKGQLNAPAALPPGEETLQSFNRKLDGQQSQSGRFGGQKPLLALPGEMSDNEAGLKVNGEGN